MKLVEVLIELPSSALDRPFDYLVKDGIEVGVGFRVLVKFGSNPKPLMGFVTKVSETSLSQEELSKARGYPISYVEEVIDRERLLSEDLYALSESLSSYYLCPRIQMLQAMLPSSLKPRRSSLKGPKIAYERYVDLIRFDEEGLTPKQKEAVRLLKEAKTAKKKEAGSPSVVKSLIEKGYLRQRLVEVNRLDLGSIKPSAPLPLTSAQQSVYEAIIEGDKEVYLLQGVTGSGKTEVYLHLSSYYLRKGRNILMLVPEISLTPAMVAYFRSRFGEQVAILHSSLTPGEKYDEYRRIARGEAKVVVGARSAVFAPLSDIGLIILDEEHVESYKQDVSPFYHAREAAIFRGRSHHCKVVLGSATPSLETRARAEKGVYGFCRLDERVNKKPLPKTEIVDLGRRGAVYSQAPMFSKLLLTKIKDRLLKKEQTVLLLNRRGYASYSTCTSCGHVFVCPSCGAHLTLHKADMLLKCHHCGYVDDFDGTCPECHGDRIARAGYGTERVCKTLEELFPEAKVARLDSDVSKIKENGERITASFKQGDFDILVGTQMIAKGHDFPLVTLVGVLLADVGLSIPTYRSGESTFDLIAQAVGRAGRGEREGEAVIQTFNPTNPAITLGAKQDYDAFFRVEMQSRRLSGYPPYSFLANLIFSASSPEKANAAAAGVKADLRSRNFEGVDALGPLIPYYESLNGVYRRELLIKFRQNEPVKGYIRDLLGSLSGKGGVRISCDVNPLEY